MRPNFLAYCNLDFKPVGDTKERSTFQRQWANTRQCQGGDADLQFALGAFPNSRTTSAFVSGIFLAFYLNAHFKTFTPSPTSYWKMLLVLSPVFAACLAAASELSSNVCLTFTPVGNSI